MSKCTLEICWWVSGSNTGNLFHDVKYFKIISYPIALFLTHITSFQSGIKRMCVKTSLVYYSIISIISSNSRIIRPENGASFLWCVCCIFGHPLFEAILLWLSFCWCQFMCFAYLQLQYVKKFLIVYATFTIYSPTPCTIFKLLVCYQSTCRYISWSIYWCNRIAT